MSASAHPLSRELASIVGDENVVDDETALKSYSQDFSPFAPISPGVVVSPGSAEEVSEVLNLANSTRTPVLTRGFGASLTGFLQAAPGRCIVLKMTRMNRVLDVDAENMTVTAECGILMRDLEETVAGKGLYVHTVAVPVGITTLGGVLSGVVGGGFPLNAAVAGTNLHYLLGLRVVLPDGRVLGTSAGGSSKYRKRDFVRGGNGPDITGLFVGDGGLFGVKVEAAMRLFPKPVTHGFAGWSFKDLQHVWRPFSKLTSLEPPPYSRMSVQVKDDFWLVYQTSGDHPSRIESANAVIDKICTEEGGRPIRASREDLEAIASGGNRRNESFVKLTRGLVAFIAGKKDYPDVYRRLSTFLDAKIAEQHLSEKGVSAVIVFRPHMHNAVYTSLSLFYDAQRPEGKEAVLNLVKEFYTMTVEMGCCPEPHQGFTSRVMGMAWSQEYKQVIESFKRILDPNGILNPGLWNLPTSHV